MHQNFVILTPPVRHVLLSRWFSYPERIAQMFQTQLSYIFLRNHQVLLLKLKVSLQVHRIPDTTRNENMEND